MRAIVGGLINDAVKCLIEHEKFNSYIEYK